MCVGCPDWQDACDDSACTGPNRKYVHFYFGDKYCEHLRERHGVEIAGYEDLTEEERNG